MSQFMVNPSHEHIQKSLHIVKYVSSTLKAKITYRTSGGEDFKAYCDADWGMDKNDQKSINGSIIQLAGTCLLEFKKTEICCTLNYRSWIHGYVRYKLTIGLA